MYDPERDDSPPRSFWLRLVLLFVIGLTAGFVLLPSMTGFEAGPDGTKSCVAIIDGWHPDEVEPVTNGPSLIDIQRANAFQDWIDGPGHCIREGRHRLIVTGIELAVLTTIVGGGLAMARTRRQRIDRLYDRAPSAEFASATAFASSGEPGATSRKVMTSST